MPWRDVRSTTMNSRIGTILATVTIGRVTLLPAPSLACWVAISVSVVGARAVRVRPAWGAPPQRRRDQSTARDRANHPDRVPRQAEVTAN
jgi:hypothetical protein